MSSLSGDRTVKNPSARVLGVAGAKLHPKVASNKWQSRTCADISLHWNHVS